SWASFPIAPCGKDERIRRVIGVSRQGLEKQCAGIVQIARWRRGGFAAPTRRAALARRPQTREAVPRAVGRSGLADVPRLQALRAIGHVELDLLAFSQRPETIALDGRVVHEHVLAALLGDEAETLRFVEPLHRTTRHVKLLLLIGADHPVVNRRTIATAARPVTATGFGEGTGAQTTRRQVGPGGIERSFAHPPATEDA